MVEQLYTNARTDTYKHPSRDVGVVMEIGRGARSGWVELEWRMGRSGATRPTSGAGAPLFGEIDTYGWDGARLIRRDWHVWSGAAAGKQAASGGVYAANRYTVVD